MPKVNQSVKAASTGQLEEEYGVPWLHRPPAFNIAFTKNL